VRAGRAGLVDRALRVSESHRLSTYRHVQPVTAAVALQPVGAGRNRLGDEDEELGLLLDEQHVGVEERQLALAGRVQMVFAPVRPRRRRRVACAAVARGPAAACPAWPARSRPTPVKAATVRAPLAVVVDGLEQPLLGARGLLLRAVGQVGAGP